MSVLTECSPTSYGHVGLIMRDDDGVTRCSICHEEADPGADDGTMTVETRVVGKGALLPTAPPPCQHVGVTQQVFFAVTRDAAGNVTERAVKLRLRCSSCGHPLRFLLPSARFSEVDDDRGLVCSVEAVSDTEAADGWQAVGEG